MDFVEVRTHFEYAFQLARANVVAIHWIFSKCCAKINTLLKTVFGLVSQAAYLFLMVFIVVFRNLCLNLSVRLIECRWSIGFQLKLCVGLSHTNKYNDRKKDGFWREDCTRNS